MHLVTGSEGAIAILFSGISRKCGSGRMSPSLRRKRPNFIDEAIAVFAGHADVAH